MHLIPNVFSTFDLTPQEQRVGEILSSLNLAVIHNLRSQKAEEKLRLTFTPADINTYIQREAELQGQIGILDYLIQCSEYAAGNNQTNVVSPSPTT